MKHQTLTVENSRIRVTVSREIADKFLPTGLSVAMSPRSGATWSSAFCRDGQISQRNRITPSAH